MKILAIDTSTEACSAALQVDGEYRECYELAPRRHAELILPMVDRLLAEAETDLGSLDCIAFTKGPGAFTGVRLCTSIAQGLAFARDLPLVPVSTLAVLAQGCRDRAEVLFSAIDARMGEIYWALFEAGEDGCVIPLSEENVSPAEDVPLQLQNGCFGCGTGWKTYRDILISRLQDRLLGFDAEKLPRAGDLLPLAVDALKRGQSVAACEAYPSYLRNKVTA